MHGSAVSCDGGKYPSIFIRLDDEEIWTWIRQKVFPSLPLETVPQLGRQIEHTYHNGFSMYREPLRKKFQSPQNINLNHIFSFP